MILNTENQIKCEGDIMPTEKKIALVDVDGCLVITNPTTGALELNQNLVEHLKELQKQGYEIILFSQRCNYLTLEKIGFEFTQQEEKQKATYDASLLLLSNIVAALARAGLTDVQVSLSLDTLQGQQPLQYYSSALVSFQTNLALLLTNEEEPKAALKQSTKQQVLENCVYINTLANLFGAIKQERKDAMLDLTYSQHKSKIAEAVRALTSNNYQKVIEELQSLLALPDGIDLKTLHQSLDDMLKEFDSSNPEFAQADKENRLNKDTVTDKTLREVFRWIYNARQKIPKNKVGQYQQLLANIKASSSDDTSDDTTVKVVMFDDSPDNIDDMNRSIGNAEGQIKPTDAPIPVLVSPGEDVQMSHTVASFIRLCNAEEQKIKPRVTDLKGTLDSWETNSSLSFIHGRRPTGLRELDPIIAGLRSALQSGDASKIVAWASLLQVKICHLKYASNKQESATSGEYNKLHSKRRAAVDGVETAVDEILELTTPEQQYEAIGESWQEIRPTYQGSFRYVGRELLSSTLDTLQRNVNGDAKMRRVMPLSDTPTLSEIASKIQELNAVMSNLYQLKKLTDNWIKMSHSYSIFYKMFALEPPHRPECFTKKIDAADNKSIDELVATLKRSLSALFESTSENQENFGSVYTAAHNLTTALQSMQATIKGNPSLSTETKALNKLLALCQSVAASVPTDKPKPESAPEAPVVEQPVAPVTAPKPAEPATTVQPKPEPAPAPVGEQPGAAEQPESAPIAEQKPAESTAEPKPEPAPAPVGERVAAEQPESAPIAEQKPAEPATTVQTKPESAPITKVEQPATTASPSDESTTAILLEKLKRLPAAPSKPTPKTGKAAPSKQSQTDSTPPTPPEPEIPKRAASAGLEQQHPAEKKEGEEKEKEEQHKANRPRANSTPAAATLTVAPTTKTP